MSADPALRNRFPRAALGLAWALTAALAPSGVIGGTVTGRVIVCGN